MEAFLCELHQLFHREHICKQFTGFSSAETFHLQVSPSLCCASASADFSSPPAPGVFKTTHARFDLNILPIPFFFALFCWVGWFACFFCISPAKFHSFHLLHLNTSSIYKGFLLTPSIPRAPV